MLNRTGDRVLEQEADEFGDMDETAGIGYPETIGITDIVLQQGVMGRDLGMGGMGPPIVKEAK